MACRYRRHADRLRCERADNPLPRPPDEWLLAEFARRTVPNIAATGGWNENTTRSWVNRAINRA